MNYNIQGAFGGGGAGGGGATANFTGCDSTATAHTTRVYAPLGFGSSNVYGSAETDEDIPVYMAFTIVRGTYNARTNSSDADATLTFRDDGVDVAPVTMTAGNSGSFATAVISTDVSSGSVCDWSIDASSVSSGSCNIRPFMVLYD